jgi:hypothetical protein
VCMCCPLTGELRLTDLPSSAVASLVSLCKWLHYTADMPHLRDEDRAKAASLFVSFHSPPPVRLAAL